MSHRYPGHIWPSFEPSRHEKPVAHLRGEPTPGIIIAFVRLRKESGLLDLAGALRNRPLCLIASSIFSARCRNIDALRDMCTAEAEEDRNLRVTDWLLGSTMRRRLGEALPGKLDNRLHLAGDDSAASKKKLHSLRQLCNHPIDLVLTMSMGHDWEQAFTAVDKVVHSIVPGQAPDYDFDAVVLHLEGKASIPESLVLGTNDVEKRRQSGLTALLSSWWNSRVFVFVGFETGDGELETVLRDLLPSDADGSEHYAFIEGASEVESEELRETFGIHVISDPGASLEPLLVNLSDVGTTPREAADLDVLMAKADADPNDPSVAAGFELLEHRLRQDGSYERLVDVHLARLSVAQEADERQRILLETASLLEHKMHDTGRAFQATLAAYKETPSKELWLQLRRRALTSDNRETLANALMESRAELRQSDRLPALLLAVESYRAVGDTTHAIEAIEMADAGPDDEERVANLHRGLLREAERWYELTRALERAANKATFLEEREEHLLQRAAILQDRLSEPWAAIECYQQVLTINPTNAHALEAIERLFLHLHQVPALLDLLYDYGDRHSRAEIIAKLWRLGDACRDRKDATGAILCFEKLRDEEPANERVLGILEELYADIGETSALVEILKAKVGTARGGQARADLFIRLAKAHEELGNIDDACECWEWVCHDMPTSDEAITSLERLYRASQRWQSLLALYSRQRELASGKDKARWILDMAELYQHQLAEFGPAVELLQDLRHSDPHNAELGARILMLLEHTGRYGEAASLSDELADTATGNAEATLRQHAARLWQQHGEPSKAVKSLEFAVKAAPKRADLEKLLGEILRGMGEHLRAAEAYDRASVLTTGFESTKNALLASQCFEALNAPERGIRVLEHRWLSSGKERVVAMELRRLYEEQGRHADLINLLENQNERAKTEEKIEHLLAMADAHAALGQHKEEVSCLERALAMDGERKDIAKQLAETALQLRMWDATEAAARSLLTDEDSVEDMAAGYCLLARQRFERGQREEAMSFLAKARERAPFDRGVLSLLVEVSTGQPEAQIGYLRALLLDASPENRADLLIQIGDLCRDHLGERAEARDAYQSALLLRPSDHLLLHRCLSIAVEERQWDESLEYLDTLTRTEKDPVVRARYRSTTAHLYEEELANVEAAIDLLWKASEEAPKDKSILSRLATHLRAKKDWPALLDCTSMYLAALRDDPEVSPEVHAKVWEELADLCNDELGDRETALCALEVAVSLQPADVNYREKLGTLYREDKRYHDAINQQQAILDVEPGRLKSYRELIKLFESLDSGDAADLCREALTRLEGAEVSTNRVAKPRKDAISQKQLTALRHPQDHQVLGRLFALATPAIAALAPRHRRRSTVAGRVQLAADAPFARKLGKLAEQLGVHTPVVYKDSQSEDDIQISSELSGELLVPVVIVSEAVIASQDDSRTVFALSQALVELRREYFVRVVQPNTQTLGHNLDALIELAENRESSPVSKTATALRNLLDDTTLEHIRALVKRLPREPGPGGEMTQNWLEASSMTAARVALWIVHDLEGALATLSTRELSEGQLRRRREDLIRAFCSPHVRADMRPNAAKPLTDSPLEDLEEERPRSRSQSLRKSFRNIARTVTQEIRTTEILLESLDLDS